MRVNKLTEESVALRETVNNAADALQNAPQNGKEAAQKMLEKAQKALENFDPKLVAAQAKLAKLSQNK